MRRLALLSLSVLLPFAAAANEAAVTDPMNQVISRASDLVPYCRSEAEAHAIGNGRTVYQWTSSYSDRANTLEVKGRLQVNDGDLLVTCRLARGARAHYASIDIVENPR